MNRRYDIVALSLVGAAVVLALLQWIVQSQGNTLSPWIEGIQAWVLIPLAVLYVGYLAFRRSAGFTDFLRRFFSSRANLPVPATILAYLSTEWFLGFHEKYNQAVWQNGIALKGFWLGAIAGSHPGPSNPFPSVAYSFWANILQFLVDHNVFSWFGYVVIGAELVIAVAFITVVVASIFRPYAIVAAAGALLALTFHFFFLMSGSAGVNALMPYLTWIAAICLISPLLSRITPPATPEIILEPIAVARETVASNGKSREPVATR